MKRFLACAALLVPFMVGGAIAEPTVQVAGGKTTVRLSEGFVGALSGLGVAPSAIAPGKLKARRGGVFISYRIPGGAVDAGDGFRGDIFHVGGLSLTAGETSVGLLNFVIDTQDEPVLTGLVTVNGSLVGRVPLFNLDSIAPHVARNGRVTISGVGVTLTDVAASALNGIFGIDAFVEGADIGTALVRTRILANDDDDSSSDD